MAFRSNGLIEETRRSIGKSLYEMPPTVRFKISIYTVLCRRHQISWSSGHCSEGLVIKYRSIDLLYLPRFMWVSSVPTEYNGIEMHSGHDYLPPDYFKFIILIQLFLLVPPIQRRLRRYWPHDLLVRF
jgi:hypothetical protein